MASEEQVKHYTKSTIKISLNITLSFLVVVILLLYQWFVLDEVLTSTESGLNYWISKILQAVATFVLMVSCANIVEESRKTKDKDFNERLIALDKHYQRIYGEGLGNDLDIYLLNINKSTKYNTYILKIKKKLQRQNKKKHKNKSLIEELEQKLLLSVDEVWDMISIKFKLINTDILFSGAVDVHTSQNSEYDLHSHKGQAFMEKLLWKALTLVAFGYLSGDLVYHFTEFSPDDIQPLLIKIAIIIWSCYSGVCFGWTMFDQIAIVLKKKMRILSQFNSRLTSKDFNVQVPFDILVDKAQRKYGVDNVCAKTTNVEEKTEQVIDNENKTEESPLKKTWQNSFGSGKPVKPQTFIMDLAKNVLEEKADI